MSIQSEIELLQNTKNELRTAIMEKGVTVYADDLYSTYPTRISQISMTPGDKDNLFRDIIERDITSITIPDGTTTIRKYCFYHCENLESVFFPESLLTISENAFRYCVSLTSVTIPSSVTRIWDWSFDHCSGLTSITINATTPPTLVGDNKNAFDNTNNCPIYVPEESVQAYKTAWTDYASRIQAIPVNTFALRFTPTGGGTPIEVELEDLATAGVIEKTDVPSTIKNGTGALEIGEGVTTIETLAFQNCTGLTSVTIPSGVTTIQINAFNCCSSLKTVNIPNTVTTISTALFGNCRSLTSITIPDSVTSIGNNAFVNCTSLTSIEIPSSVTSIGNGAFNGCSSLKTVNIPNTVTTISTALFSNCTGLTSVTIPSGVTSIGNGAFKGCTSLTSIEIPSSVTSIGNGAFKGCTSLDYVTVNATTPPTLGTDTFLNTNACPILVVPESVQAYKTAWSAYADRITCEGVAYWKLLGGTCDTNESGYNTGYVTNTYEDANPTSPTYGNTRTETVQDEVTCSTQVWELIGSVCETDGSDKNTGYLQKIYEDVNPSSSTYGQQRTETVQDEETCPIPAAPEFRRIQYIQDVTSGKYLIVDTANNIALNASLIASTTSGTNGINANNNYISVDIDTADDTIEATETTLNAAVDYDSSSYYLTWTDENSGTVYYLTHNSSSASAFRPNATSSSEITPFYSVNGGFTFDSEYNRAIALYTNTSNISKFRWQDKTKPSNFDNVALFKLDE